jgi:uncharacterized sulfatase
MANGPLELRVNDHHYGNRLPVLVSPMHRRRFLQLSAGAGLWLAAAPLVQAAPERPPNVVMIVSDDQGWTDFGFMGHTVIQTPRLDRLAEESAIFTQGYVPTSLCRASLATLLTGLYPHQHRICCNDPPAGVDRTQMHPFIRQAPTIPRLLGQAGYVSLQTGKFWEGHFANAGFTHGQNTDKDRHISITQPQIGRTGMQPILDFIDQNQEKPFFVWYAPMMPHLPHNPPERLLKKYQVPSRDPNQAKYYAMCEWLDETVGTLLDHLDKRQLSANTLVVFVIDNGWIQPTVEEKKPGPFGRDGAKRSPNDMGIRTPVLLRWPGHTRVGRYHDLVSTVDLAPTVLQACGQKAPENMKGVSLLNVACGKGKLERQSVFGEIYLHSATKLGAPELDVTHRWVRHVDWKLILDLKAKHPELYQIVQDPFERTDLAEKAPERVRELTKMIDKWVMER